MCMSKLRYRTQGRHDTSKVLGGTSVRSKWSRAAYRVRSYIKRRWKVSRSEEKGVTSFAKVSLSGWKWA